MTHCILHTRVQTLSALRAVYMTCVCDCEGQHEYWCHLRRSASARVPPAMKTLSTENFSATRACGRNTVAYTILPSRISGRPTKSRMACSSLSWSATSAS